MVETPKEYSSKDLEKSKAAMPPTQTGRKTSSSARKTARTDEASKGLLDSLDSRTVNSITAIPLRKRDRI